MEPLASRVLPEPSFTIGYDPQFFIHSSIRLSRTMIEAILVPTIFFVILIENKLNVNNSLMLMCYIY